MGYRPPPVQVSSVEKPSEVKILYEMWKGTRLDTRAPIAPLHGYKGGGTRMNIVNLDDSNRVVNFSTLKNLMNL